jgi:plastocyanin
MRRLRSLSVIAAFLVAAAACTSAAPGWTYAPAPSATPLPSVSPSGSPGASASASSSASAEPSGSASTEPSASASASGGAGEVLQIAAQNIAFDTTQEAVPAGTPFQIHFTNNDAGIPHNVAIHDQSNTEIFKGEIFPGVADKTYDVPALQAGAYTFICTVHPTMTGSLTAE